MVSIKKSTILDYAKNIIVVIALIIILLGAIGFFMKRNRPPMPAPTTKPGARPASGYTPQQPGLISAGYAGYPYYGNYPIDYPYYYNDPYNIWYYYDWIFPWWNDYYYKRSNHHHHTNTTHPATTQPAPTLPVTTSPSSIIPTEPAVSIIPTEPAVTFAPTEPAVTFSPMINTSITLPIIPDITMNIPQLTVPPIQMEPNIPSLPEPPVQMEPIVQSPPVQMEPIVQSPPVQMEPIVQSSPVSELSPKTEGFIGYSDSTPVSCYLKPTWNASLYTRGSMFVNPSNYSGEKWETAKWGPVP